MPSTECTESTSRRRRPSILLAEDDEDQRRAMRRILEGEGYEVREVSGGEAAIRAATRDCPDLVMLDVDMPPGIDGFETCKRIQELCDPSPLFLFVSADSSESKAVRGMDLGGMDYLSKPYSVGHLCAKVRAAIRVRHELEGLRNRVSTDSLTGALRADAVAARGRSLLALCERMKRDLSALMMDIDHFKAINDEFGHAMGDRVLRRVGQSIRGGCREADVVFRVGGEEFLVLAPATDGPGATILGERLRLAVRSRPTLLSSLTGESTRRVVTLSVGLATWAPGETLEELLRRADGALYEAKRAGRDRLATAPAGRIRV